MENKLIDTTKESTDPLDKSEARKHLVDSLRNLDVTNFDTTPWTDENVIRPLPGAQERFLTSTAQVTFYGGEHVRYLS